MCKLCVFAYYLHVHTTQCVASRLLNIWGAVWCGEFRSVRSVHWNVCGGAMCILQSTVQLWTLYTEQSVWCAVCSHPFFTSSAAMCSLTLGRGWGEWSMACMHVLALVPARSAFRCGIRDSIRSPSHKPNRKPHRKPNHSSLF